MKKWMSMLILGASLLVLASGCSHNEPNHINQVEQNVEEPGGGTPQESEVPQENLSDDIKVNHTTVSIEAVQDTNYLEGLNVGSSYTLEMADEDVLVELYVSSEVDAASGEMILDDGQEWALVARVGEGVYPLVERTYIQNGQLNYTVYTDYDQNEMPHIMAQISSGAGITYYDCTYDETSKTFSRQTVFEADNINVLYKF